MRICLMVAAVLSLGAAAHAQSVPTIVVGGNQLIADSLEVVDSRVFVKDIQVWPAVLRPSAERDMERARLLLDTAPALNMSTHEANVAARAKERALHVQGYSKRAIADSIAAFYRSCTQLVSNATVEASEMTVNGHVIKSIKVWIMWSTGKREEWMLDNNLGDTSPRVDPAISTATLWRTMLARGCTIYVGDGYVYYVPARRSSIKATLQQTLINRRLTKVNVGRVPDDGVERIEGVDSDVLRDLQFPQPLDSLRTRR